MAPLPCIRPSGVQENQGDTRPVFLKVDAMRFAADFDMDIAADYRLDETAHAGTAAKYCRGNASTSLKYCKLAMKGCRSPSSTASPRLVKAKRSCQPGRGIGCQYSAHPAGVAR